MLNCRRVLATTHYNYLLLHYCCRPEAVHQKAAAGAANDGSALALLIVPRRTSDMRCLSGLPEWTPAGPHLHACPPLTL